MASPGCMQVIWATCNLPAASATNHAKALAASHGPHSPPNSVDYDLWTGPAPMKPLARKNLHYDWHWDTDTGNGDIGNQGIHQMDICRWAIGASSMPRRVTSIGGRLGYIDDGNTPNTQVALLEYGTIPMLFEVRDCHATMPRSRRTGMDPWTPTWTSASHRSSIAKMERSSCRPDHGTAGPSIRDGKRITSWSASGRSLLQTSLPRYVHADQQVISMRTSSKVSAQAISAISANISHQLGELRDRRTPLWNPLLCTGRIPRINQSHARAHLRKPMRSTSDADVLSIGPWLDTRPDPRAIHEAMTPQMPSCPVRSGLHSRFRTSPEPQQNAAGGNSTIVAAGSTTMSTDHDKARRIADEAIAVDRESRDSLIASACKGDDALSKSVYAMIEADCASHTVQTPRPDTDTHVQHPEQIAHFTIRRVIGSGGMGTVYEGVQDNPRRKVALKVMRSGVTSRMAQRRFAFESQVLARLHHQGIAQIYEAGTWDDGGGGVPWFAMEYISGAKALTSYAQRQEIEDAPATGSLHQGLRSRRPWSPEGHHPPGSEA